MYNSNIQINIHEEIHGSSWSKRIDAYPASKEHQNWQAQDPLVPRLHI